MPMSMTAVFTGRSNLSPSTDGSQQDPLSNRACGFPAHGLRAVVGGRDVALRSLRVRDGAKESVQAEGVEVARRPSSRFTRFEVTTFALDTHALEPPGHIPVDRVELLGGVSGAEVLSPSAQHGIELDDYIARIVVAARPWGHVFHALPYPLHALRRWPALEKMDALSLARLFPYRSRELLPQMTAKKIDPLFAPAEIDALRLVLM